METALCFDSGIGGLAYLNYLRQIPMRWVYLADNLYFPFGEQKQNSLRQRICTIISRALIDYPARFVLLLCNTATVLALQDLRRIMPEQQFIGTVPAIKPAAMASQRKKIVMLASRSTSQATYVAELCRQFAQNCELQAINAAPLIQFIEEDWRPGISTETEIQAAIAPFIQPIHDSGADQVVLGCTHFLHLKETLRLQLQAIDPEIQLCDSLSGVYGRLQELRQMSCNQSRTIEPKIPSDLLLLTQKGSQRWKYWGKHFSMDIRFLPIT